MKNHRDDMASRHRHFEWLEEIRSLTIKLKFLGQAVGEGSLPHFFGDPRESRYGAILRLRRRISNTIRAAPAASQIMACNTVVLMVVVSFLLSAGADYPLPVYAWIPIRYSAEGVALTKNYRDALRFLRRIINITSAAPAAIQMIVCIIMLFMVSHFSFL
jgi:hypothetical protein